jgi:hypothetical protein
MKQSGASEGRPASDLISNRIAELRDWRGETLVRMRALIKEADPDVVEEWKWVKPTTPGTPIKISAECRPFSSTAYGPPADYPDRGRVIWGVLQECAEASGGDTNLDFGRTGGFLSQPELHEAIPGTLETNSGEMHVKMTPHWDLGTAIRFCESLGFKGLYTIEVDYDPAVRMIYNTVLANLA